MAPFGLLLVLAAVPDAGLATWKVTHITSNGSDLGNGRIYATAETTTVVTPSEVRMSAEGERGGKTTKNVSKPKPLAPALRDAVTALLPKLPKESATFSTSPYVDDEGWNNSSIAYELDGKVVTFNLNQGKGPAPVPPEVNELLQLVARALR